MTRFLAPLWVAVGCAATASEPHEEPELAQATDPLDDDGVAVADPEPLASPPVRSARTEEALTVRLAPAADAAVRGVTVAGADFEIVEAVDGPGCDGTWWRVALDGYVCLGDHELSDSAPVAQPPLVIYDPPRPDEFEHYLETGEYDAGEPEALVPNVYAKRWRRFKGQLYASVDAFAAGEPPVGRLEGGAGNKYRFVERVQTDKGEVLLRDDGKVAAVDDVYLYPVSRLTGFDLEREPLDDGLWPAFAISYEGTPLHRSPDEASEVAATVPYHSPLLIRKEPANPTGRWWEIPDALGPGVPGYANDWRGLRHPVASTGRPDEVADDELWVDIELDQQVLMLWRGDELAYFTLVSTGAAPMGTPRGLYRITDKMATKTMRSRPDSDDPYYVEDVPWTTHFRPAYALHGAYWHWGFGRTASHGCVNMSAADVRHVFEVTEPKLPPGWHTVFPTEEEPGATVRVRRRDLETPDRRDEFRSELL